MYYTTPLSSIYTTTIYSPLPLSCTLFPLLSFPSYPPVSFSLPLLWHALIPSPPNVPTVYRLLFFFPRPLRLLLTSHLTQTPTSHIHSCSHSCLLSPSRSRLSLPPFLFLPSSRNDIREHELLVESELTRVGDSFSFSLSLPPPPLHTHTHICLIPSFTHLLSLLSSYSYIHTECAVRNSPSQWIYCVSESSLNARARISPARSRKRVRTDGYYANERE